MKLEKMIELIDRYNAGEITKAEAESLSWFQDKNQIILALQTHGAWFTFDSCCCPEGAHHKPIKGEFEISNHYFGITLKK